MDKPHLRNFGGDSSCPGGGVAGGPGGDYTQIGSSDSDDSRSSISRSEENETLPCIVYTSDDSADVGQSDSTCCIDSEALGYIAHNVHQNQEDGGSRCLLLGSGSPSPQPSPQPAPCFPNGHPLAAITFSTGSDPELGVGDPEMAKEPVVGMIAPGSCLKVRVGTDSSNYGRSTSVSSESSGSSPGTQLPLLPDYHQLPDFSDFPDVEYEPLSTDPAPTKKLPMLGRSMVGDDVHIRSKFKDSFYVNWNWSRIRQSCVFLNLSILICLLCVGIGLLIQMPRGSECNPTHMWWQGSVMYEIYVPSFQDADSDGVGDLSGIVSKLDYLQNLGIKAVRLNSILETEDYLYSPTPVTNYSAVDPLLGSNKDLHLLAALLHERNMYLLLDVPLTSATHTDEEINLSEKSVQHVSEGLRYWLSLGVDGFYFTDILEFVDDPGLLEVMHVWRNILDGWSQGMEHRVLMVPLELLDTLKTSHFPHLDHLLHLVDLINVPVNLTGPAQAIPDVLNTTTAWDSHASLPWINWNMGGARKERIFDQTNISPLGRSFLLLFFPGTVTLYYGDEIGLTESEQGNGWSSIMQWNDGMNAGFSSHKPWQSLSVGWENGNVNAQNDTIAALTTMVNARQEKVPIYINGIFDYVGDFHPTKTSNYRVRYVDQDLIIIDRFFPRRNQYAVVANLGANVLNKDLSSLYFGGSVLASSHGQSGYIKFREITLQPGESLVCILDL